MIFAWDELNELARDNVDGARGRLLDILCDYQGMRGCELIVVFDAYRVQGHKTEMYDYHNIHVVYTREAETADQYIEKFAHENGRKYRVTVATSDGLEQIIIRGAGCGLISARELEKEITRKRGEMLETYQAKREPEKRCTWQSAFRMRWQKQSERRIFMNKQEEVKFTQSGFLKIDGKKRVSVRFERGSDIAEGMLPPGKITKNHGFSDRK